jgi:hypothetical protein
VGTLGKDIDVFYHQLSMPNCMFRFRSVIQLFIMVPSYSLAWDETSVAYEEVISSEGWLTGQIVVPSINAVVHKAGLFTLHVLSVLNILFPQFALMMISRCAFGIPLAYKESGSNPLNPDFPEALVTIIKNFVLFAVMPRWMLRLPFKKYIHSWRPIHSLDISTDSKSPERRGRRWNTRSRLCSNPGH